MDYIKVAVLDNAFEAYLIEEVLNDQRIPHIIQSYHDDVYGNLFQMTKGWGAVQAPSSFREHIITVLQDIRTSQLEQMDNNEEEKI
jgi:hypothetical protein